MTCWPRAAARRVLGLRTASWPDHSRLFCIVDRSTWVIHWEMMALRETAFRLGIRKAHPFWMPHSRNQAVFYGSQFFLLAEDWIERPHRIATAYFHGKPGTGYEEFDALYERVKRHHGRIGRIQVSHSEMERLLLETGMAPEKIHRIPIGIDTELFRMRVPERIAEARIQYGLPRDGFVVGSFQKDGEGWGAGNEPKMIKGPDVFVRVLSRLRRRIPSLHVLLTGPARGYVKQELRKAGVPFTHYMADKYTELPGLFQALDAYLVSSRQEGGPKAVLESMASGVPLVTTRVGQAMDLVRDGENAWMTDVEDEPGLADRLEHIFRDPDAVAPVLSEGRRTAEANAYPQLDPLWSRLFDGFVEATM